jgi:UDP-N-acetylmuramyl tripeptide synthase
MPSMTVANTTPDAITLHAALAGFLARGADACAMEVSSIGLDQGRINGAAFDVAVFTNLTRDHLEYHGTMEAYAAAKEKLFAMPGLGAAVINLDDAFGSALAQRLRGRLPVLGYTLGTSGARAGPMKSCARKPAHGRRRHRVRTATAPPSPRRWSAASTHRICWRWPGRC